MCKILFQPLQLQKLTQLGKSYLWYRTTQPTKIAVMVFFQAQDAAIFLCKVNEFDNGTRNWDFSRIMHQ